MVVVSIRLSRSCDLASRALAGPVFSLLFASVLCGCGAAPSDDRAPTDADAQPAPADPYATTQPFAADPQGEATRRGLEGAFAASVVRFEPGEGAGFGAAAMPWVVLGGPRGAGDARGSIDVVSLGTGGVIELAFGKTAIVDAPGPDFIVFENAFRFGAGGRTYAEFGRVSVSDDGVRWVDLPCNAATGEGCAGRAPVFANVETNTLACTDPALAGGDAFDLEASGLARARFVRVTDLGTYPASSATSDGKGGFDLDAIAVIHGANDP